MLDIFLPTLTVDKAKDRDKTTLRNLQAGQQNVTSKQVINETKF